MTLRRLMRVALLLGLLLQFATSVSAQDEQQTLTLLETSDLHGNLMPWDYYSNKSAEWGLAKVATLIRQERSADPNLLLLDAGDTIQGTPLAYYYNVIDTNAPNPMALTMSSLGYDAVAIGNHEFNYGRDVLQRYIDQASYPVLSANTRTTDGGEAYKPYIIKEVKGVKVGILGMTTATIPTWEKPQNIAGLRFDDPVAIASRYVPQMRSEGADVVVVLQHIGWEKAPKDAGQADSWLTDSATWPGTGSLPGENETVRLAEQVPGIDAIMVGHSHLNVPKTVINGVIITEPSYWGRNLSKITLNVQKVDGRWQVTGKDSTSLSVTNVAPDPDLAALAQPYHDQTLQYISQPVGTTTAAFEGGPRGRYRDGALADLINTVQKQAAAAAGYPVDLSLAALFTDGGMLPAGQIALRDAYSIYIYDNTLYVMEINGDILRRALERDAEYFRQLDPNALPDDPKGVVADNARDYNWDLYSDVEYTIDLTRPAGERVTQLRYKGQDVTPDQPFRIAINNYRAGGGGAYAMFREGTIVWQSTYEVRDLIADYLKQAGTLDPQQVNQQNFTLVPDLYAHYFAPQPPTPDTPVSLPDTSAPTRSTVLVGMLALLLLALGLHMRRRQHA